MKSIWTNEIEKPEFKTLDGDTKTDVLIIGGGITGILCGYMLRNAGVDCVIAEARSICSGVTENTTAKITYHHGAIFDKMIRRYGVDKASLYVKANKRAIEKYNKWGMTSSMVAASILCDLVQGKENEYAEVFSPSRSILHGQLLVNTGESVLGLITPTVPRCSHLGCALKYNKQEHSWDCACHGSRFTEDGRIINNPAMKDINIKK